MLCADSLESEQISAEDFAEIISRIIAGEPVQYVIGEETFFGRTFSVGEGVLIPRPETEELCQWIIEECRIEGKCRMQNAGCRISGEEQSCILNSEFSILDVGTGSGAIAITLAKEINARITAIDISEKALSIAKHNAEKLGADVNFIQADILDANSAFCIQHSAFDIIASNPPYIMEKERAEMSQHVLDHEPSLALFVPDHDPLLFYRAIADFAQQHLAPEGLLFFEINPLCADEMQQMLAAKGFSNIELRTDQFGKKRMIKATR